MSSNQDRNAQANMRVFFLHNESKEECLRSVVQSVLPSRSESEMIKAWDGIAPAVSRESLASDSVRSKWQGLGLLAWIVPPRHTQRGDKFHWHPVNITYRVIRGRILDVRSLLLKGGRFLSRFDVFFGFAACMYSELFRLAGNESPQDRAYQELKKLLNAHALDQQDCAILIDPPDAVLAVLPFLLLTNELPARRTLILEVADATSDEEQDHEPCRLDREALFARLKRLGDGVIEKVDGDRLESLVPALRERLKTLQAGAPEPLPVNAALLAVDANLLDIEAGNSTVVKRQIHYLASRGYATVVLAINPAEVPRKRLNSEQIRRLAKWPIVAHAESWSRPGLSDWRRISRIVRSGPHTFARPIAINVEAYTGQTLPNQFLDLARSSSVAVAVANYLWTVPLLRKAGFTGRLVCESHDVQCRQRARYRNSDVDSEDLNSEITALEQADAVIAISDSEAQFFTSHLSKPEIHYVVCGFEPNRLAEPAAAPLDAICRMAGRLERSADLDAGKLDGPLDLLFVGSHNGHNLKGIQWFVRRVLPQIGDDVRLVVAGSVLKLLERQEDFASITTDSRIRVLGRVEHLQPLYAAARIVIVPLLSGEGTSIKTVEAMAYGKPVVATPKGLRGMGDIKYPSYSEPKAYAEACRTLLADNAERARLAEASWMIANERFSMTAFYAKLDVVMSTSQHLKK